MAHGGTFFSLNETDCEFFASEQFQNPPFEPVNNNRSSACAVQISEAANERLKQTPADTEEKANLRKALLNLPPIGLKLSNTSFLDSEEMGVFHANNTKCDAGSRHSSRHGGVQAEDSIDSEKLKASNFSVSLLRIGSWEEVSKREGALVAKCYYAKKKLVWEILKESLKSKIEIQWSDILAISASIVEDQPGILEVELSSPPNFYQETDPMPRKHTIWKISSDFTDGQALIHRRHYLEFPPGALDKHYEKLLQCDIRMSMLSQRPFPSLSSPYFHSDFYNGTREFSLDVNRDGSNISSSLQLPFSNVPRPLVVMQQFQAYKQINQPCFSINDISTGEDISNQGVDNPRMAIWSQDMIDSADVLGRDQIQEPFSIPIANQTRDQIRDPFTIPIETQVNPTISPQNYNGSAPYAAQVWSISDSQICHLNDIINYQLNKSDSELQCIDQNRYIAMDESFFRKGCN